MRQNIHVRRIVSAPFAENTFVVRIEGKQECVLVDPGLDPDQIVAYLEREKLTPVMMLITHGHADHIGGNAEMKRLWPACPIVIGRLDAIKLTDPVQNLSQGFGFAVTSPPADRLLNEGDRVEAAGLTFLVRDLPGHSIGHVVFITEGQQPTLVFAGDTLMAGSTGRWDFPDGDRDQLIGGIREKLFTLNDDTIVYAGHGPRTTIGEERHSNPVMNGEFR